MEFHKFRTILAFATAAALALTLAAVAVAADPNGATGHGADVWAVAKAVHTTQGNAHGKAVSAIASAHGKAVSAAAAANKANGAAAKDKDAEHGNGNRAAGASEAPDDEAPASEALDDEAPAGDAPAEPGRVKDSAPSS